VAVTDGSGNVVERYEYTDFGDPTVLDLNYDPVAGNESAIGNPYLFTGRRYDPETGLYWYRTRYYDPVGGRFTSRDKIGTWGDPFNLGNGSVDLLESATFQNCFGHAASTGHCLAFDQNQDGLIDGDDVAPFAASLTGPRE